MRSRPGGLASRGPPPASLVPLASLFLRRPASRNATWAIPVREVQAPDVLAWRRLMRGTPEPAA